MMKIYLKLLSYAILVSLFSISNVHSQKLVEQNKLWSFYTFTGIIPGTDHPGGYTLAYSFGEAETLDNNTYLRFRKSDTFSYDSFWEDTDILMREDSLGKVYLKEEGEPEKLIYDFSLEENEVFQNQYTNCIDSIISKDSILLSSGFYRERWNFSSGVEWIRGMGSTTSIISNCDWEVSAICYQEDLHLVYDPNEYGPNTNQSFSYCIWLPVNTNETSFKTISVFPNPVIHTLTIQSEEESLSGDLVIFNAMGQKVHQEKLMQIRKTEIDFSTYPSGIYHLELGALKRKFIKIN